MRNLMHLKSIYLKGTILMMFLISCSQQGVKVERIAQEEQEEIDNESKDWILIFNEDFDDDNLSKWNIWKSGAYNQEIQYYRPEQLVVDEGVLSINIKRQPITGATNPFNSSSKSFEYVSGRIESKNKYGPSNASGEREYRFVARIKMPAGNGMWPAFWTVGDSWPTQGEIDIIEARGNEPMKFASNIFYGIEPGVTLTKNDGNTVTNYVLDTNITAGFHDYELIWRENNLDILFDNKLLKRYEATPLNYINDLFGKQHNVVLNTAVGGFYFPPNAESNTFADNAVMQIAWVKVYRK